MIAKLNNYQSIDIPFFVKGSFFVIFLINKHASKFFTLHLFYIFIHLYNGTVLERLAKSKKVKKIININFVAYQNKLSY